MTRRIAWRGCLLTADMLNESGPAEYVAPVLGGEVAATLPGNGHREQGRIVGATRRVSVPEPPSAITTRVPTVPVRSRFRRAASGVTGRHAYGEHGQQNLCLSPFQGWCIRSANGGYHVLISQTRHDAPPAAVHVCSFRPPVRRRVRASVPGD